MFKNLFTTYEMVEPPPVVSKDIKLVQQNYEQFLQTKPLTDYRGIQEVSFDSMFPKQSDPLKTAPEAPVSFDEYKPEVTSSQKPITVPPEKSTSKPSKSNGAFSNKRDFVKTLNNAYRQSLQEHGYDPNYSYILTSAAVLESGWGKKVSGNYNYGGVKGKYGTVKSTIDYINGKYVRRDQTFRNFNSVKDYCDFVVGLLSNKRYNAFNTYSSSNPLGFWRHVLDAGYGGGDEAGKDAYMNSVRSIHNTVMQWT